MGIFIFPWVLFWIIFVFAFVFYIPYWVYKDAQKRGMNAMAWALFVFFISAFVGLIIYLVVRGPQLDDDVAYYPPKNQKQQAYGTRRCSHCHETIDLRSAVCPHCGEQLKDNCPYCHQPIEPSWQRCAHCGEPIPDYMRG